MLQTRNRPLLLAAVMAVSICQFLDATIANVALPHMQAALGASSGSISWVLTTFIVTTAIATPITGWLSDRVGSRRLFISATLLFLLTSAACGAATSLPEMVLFRGLQGIAAAFIGPLTLTIMFDISAPSKQAMTVAVFSMIVMVAPISGPFLGGFLTEYLNWRWIFYVNLPLGIPALALLWLLLPSRPLERRPLDIFGFVMIGVGLASLQLMLDRGQHNDWFNSWETIFELLIALCAIWVFVLHSRDTATPLFKRELYKNTNFLFSLAFMAVMGIAVVGLSSVLPMMFQTIYGYPVMETGLMMGPRGIGVMISSLLAGVLARQVDPRLIMSVGYVIAAAGMFSMTRWAIEMDSTPILLASFVQGIGFGFVTSPMNLLAFATLSPAVRPDGSSLSSLFRSLGGSIGISIIVMMLARNQQVSHADLAAHVVGYSTPALDMQASPDQVSELGAGTLAAIEGQVSRQALMIAYLDNFYMLSWVLLAFAPLPYLLKRPPRMGANPPPPME
ncbi:DHA2 family efflux MFS transporter permease subunit [Novosphingobium sp. G106]|uniref:DHA2 family efflux MFS transporter permease subunit n=1 Tax=Novosphingobium sp. G106 TaxID=2849500 RepID=UPI001C2CD4BB|nr:DHA2 family efflux MFS transporter permease subunit [Novosphingobium sp. G106]MBV1686847.1 DHA2 family efflux MFS transporter permease subunit [Novosphingobium sp. G106]